MGTSLSWMLVVVPWILPREAENGSPKRRRVLPEIRQKLARPALRISTSRSTRTVITAAVEEAGILHALGICFAHFPKEAIPWPPLPLRDPKSSRR